MLIAICEDDPVYRDGIESYCHSWKEKHQDLSVAVHTYSSPEALLNVYERPLDYDIYFLDIEFSKNSAMNGYRLAELIREHNRSSIIVFITNSKLYMQQGYTVTAYRYLVKPIDREDVASCLDHCLETALSATDPFLSLARKEGIRRIPLKEIILIQSGIHNVSIHTVHEVETLRLYESFEKYASSLPKEWFLQCQRGLLINVLYITRFTKETIYLSTGVDYSIGRRYRSHVYEHLQNFFDGGLQ